MESITSRDGTRIAYAREGEGPPLLLVHGTTADHTRWSGISPALEARFTVYGMDRRGRGGSGDAEPYAIEREFEDVAAVIDAIGEPVDVLGHSYGALCALEASLLTEKIRRLVLYEPPMSEGSEEYPPEALQQMNDWLEAGEREAALEVFFRKVVRMPQHELERYRKLPAWRVRIGLAHTIPRELAAEEAYRIAAGRFESHRTPTLLLLGGDSPSVFRNASVKLAGLLPRSWIAVLAGQQHVAMDMDPEAFLGPVTGFLEGAAPPH